MPLTKPRALLDIEYEEAAQAYLRSLPMEHFMEATAQSCQRVVSSESLDRWQRIRQVVPDTMVFVHPEPIIAESSFNLPLQKARPYWMLEYVSEHNKRKDYDASFRKYERELRVPYYLCSSQTTRN